MPLESSLPPRLQSNDNPEKEERYSARQKSIEKRSSVANSDESSLPARYSASAPERSNVPRKVESSDRPPSRRLSSEKRSQRSSLSSPKPTVSAPQSGRNSSRQELDVSKTNSRIDSRLSKHKSSIVQLSRSPARDQLKPPDDNEDLSKEYNARLERHSKRSKALSNHPLPPRSIGSADNIHRTDKKQSKSRTSVVRIVPPTESADDVRRLEKRSNKSKTSLASRASHTRPSASVDDVKRTEKSNKSKASAIRLPPSKPSESADNIKRPEKRSSKKRVSEGSLLSSTKSIESSDNFKRDTKRPSKSISRLSPKRSLSSDSGKRHEKRISKSKTSVRAIRSSKSIESEENVRKRSERPKSSIDRAVSPSRKPREVKKNSVLSRKQPKESEYLQQNERPDTSEEPNEKISEKTERRPSAKKKNTENFYVTYRAPQSSSLTSDTSYPETTDGKAEPRSHHPKDKRFHDESDQKKEKGRSVVAAQRKLSEKPTAVTETSITKQGQTTTERRVSAKKRVIDHSIESTSITSEDSPRRSPEVPPRKQPERRPSAPKERRSTNIRKQNTSAQLRRTEKISESSDASNIEQVAAHPKVYQRAPSEDRNLSSHTQPPWKVGTAPPKSQKLSAYSTDTSIDTYSPVRSRKSSITRKSIDYTPPGSPPRSYGRKYTQWQVEEKSISSPYRQGKVKERSKSVLPTTRSPKAGTVESQDPGSPQWQDSPPRRLSPPARQTSFLKSKGRTARQSTVSVLSNDPHKSVDITSSRLSATSADRRPFVLKTILKRSSPTAKQSNEGISTPPTRKSLLLRNEKKKSWAI